jgi:hypothetical protein
MKLASYKIWQDSNSSSIILGYRPMRGNCHQDKVIKGLREFKIPANSKMLLIGIRLIVFDNMFDKNNQ